MPPQAQNPDLGKPPSCSRCVTFTAEGKASSPCDRKGAHRCPTGHRESCSGLGGSPRKSPRRVPGMLRADARSPRPWGRNVPAGGTGRRATQTGNSQVPPSFWAFTRGLPDPGVTGGDPGDPLGQGRSRGGGRGTDPSVRPARASPSLGATHTGEGAQPGTPPRSPGAACHPIDRQG